MFGAKPIMWCTYIHFASIIIESDTVAGDGSYLETLAWGVNGTHGCLSHQSATKFCPNLCYVKHTLKRDQTVDFLSKKSLFPNWQDNLTLNKAQYQCNTMRGHEALKEDITDFFCFSRAFWQEIRRVKDSLQNCRNTCKMITWTTSVANPSLLYLWY